MFLWRFNFEQLSNNCVGITWETLHILTPGYYWPKKRDYISLPLESRTSQTIIRWLQRETLDSKQPRLHWAIDNIHIGGKEINPSDYTQSFPDAEYQDDPRAWEFSPHGSVKGPNEECLQDGVQGYAMVWSSPGHDYLDEEQSFITNQMIVQRGHMMQFKVLIVIRHNVDFHIFLWMF